MNVRYILHAFVALEWLKITEVHNNIGLCLETQADGQLFSGTNEAHLAFLGSCEANLDVGPSGLRMQKTKNKKQNQAEATKWFWICVIAIKTQMNDPAGCSQWCANQWGIDNEHTESVWRSYNRRVEVQNVLTNVREEKKHHSWWPTQTNTTALFLWFKEFKYSCIFGQKRKKKRLTKEPTHFLMGLRLQFTV